MKLTMSNKFCTDSQALQLKTQACVHSQLNINNSLNTMLLLNICQLLKASYESQRWSC